MKGVEGTKRKVVISLKGSVYKKAAVNFDYVIENELFKYLDTSSLQNLLLSDKKYSHLYNSRNFWLSKIQSIDYRIYQIIKDLLTEDLFQSFDNLSIKGNIGRLYNSTYDSICNEDRSSKTYTIDELIKLSSMLELYCYYNKINIQYPTLSTLDSINKAQLYYNMIMEKSTFQDKKVNTTIDNHIEQIIFFDCKNKYHSLIRYVTFKFFEDKETNNIADEENNKFQQFFIFLALQGLSPMKIVRDKILDLDELLRFHKNNFDIESETIHERV